MSRVSRLRDALDAAYQDGYNRAYRGSHPRVLLFDSDPNDARYVQMARDAGYVAGKAARESVVLRLQIDALTVEAAADQIIGGAS